jgi:hypothetical protein
VALGPAAASADRTPVRPARAKPGRRSWRRRGAQPLDQPGARRPASEAFITIGDLLGGSIAPPLVTAALYRAAALIPGVTMVADATDAIGRHGVGVAMTIEDVRYEWIFSSHTLRYLGERDIYVTKPRDLHITPGSIASESAVLQRAFVNHPGQTPASSSR